MVDNPRRAAALKLLSSTGMWRSNYLPPYLRLLWWMGIDAPPPHLAGFSRNALSLGTYFALVWGSFMWLLFWRRGPLPITMGVGSALIAGALFGLAMASYYASGRRRYGLPYWSELKASTP